MRYQILHGRFIVLAQDGSEVPVASTKNAESEVEVAEAEATEEIVETPKEMAKRLKREAKEAAAKTKAEERLAQMEAKKIMAEEKAVAKVRRRCLSGVPTDTRESDMCVDFHACLSLVAGSARQFQIFFRGYERPNMCAQLITALCSR